MAIAMSSVDKGLPNELVLRLRVVKRSELQNITHSLQ